MNTPAKQSPQTLAEGLIGHRVRLTLTNGHTREGTIIGCGPSGFQFTSGIGGRMLFYYGEVDAIDDLGTAKPHDIWMTTENVNKAGLTQEEWVEDRHAAYVASLTTGQRFRRWVWLYSGQLWTLGVLLAVIAALIWWEYLR